MASRPKRARRQVEITEEILQYVLEAERDSDEEIDTGGSPVDEESDLDRELGLVCDDSR